MPKISAFSIVFNIEQTLPEGMFQACVASLYPHVSEWIIVEGATRAKNHYFDGNAAYFTRDGRSTDKTLDILYSLPDNDNKIKIFRSKGWWDGKTSMCQVASDHAVGDYLWQVDSDEFYKEDDIPKIIDLIDSKKPDTISFNANNFFGDFNHYIGAWGTEWGNAVPWKRIFKTSVGGRWESHEPPVYRRGDGASSGRIIDVAETQRLGVDMYHYCYVSHSQVRFKSKFYGNTQYELDWHNFHHGTGRKFSQGVEIREFTGTHPKIIQEKFL